MSRNKICLCLVLVSAAVMLGLDACQSHRPPVGSARPEYAPSSVPPTVALPPSYPRAATEEMRGVWISDPRGVNWRLAMTDLRAAGFNTVFVNFSSGGAAFYPSSLLPNVASRDEARLCIDAAHALGIQVHAKFIVWYMFQSPTPYQKRLTREGRLLKTLDGKILWQGESTWLNPASRINRDARLAQISEALQRYPVDGVQLDYIRFPDNAGPITSARLYLNTQFVSDVRAEIRRSRPGIPLSVSNFYDYTRARNQMGQDWVVWASRRLVDFLCPMDYTRDNATFDRWIDAQQRLVNGSVPIYPGVGAYMLSGPSQVNDQIAQVRRLHNRGFVVFAYNEQFRQQMLPWIRF